MVSLIAQGAALADPLTAGAMQIGFAGLSKMLHSPRGVRLLMEGMKMPLNVEPARAATYLSRMRAYLDEQKIATTSPQSE